MGREIPTRKMEHAGMFQLRLQPVTPKAGRTCLKMLEVLGLGGGLTALLIGLVLSTVGWAEGSLEGGHILVVCGTGLLLAAAPLLLLGAHCLDVEESCARRARDTATPTTVASVPNPLARGDGEAQGTEAGARQVSALNRK